MEDSTGISAEASFFHEDGLETSSGLIQQKQLLSNPLLRRKRRLSGQDLLADTTAFLPLGVSSIDDLLKQGGISSGIINEVFGCSGSGKTEFCLQLVAHTFIEAASASQPPVCVYFHTQQQFPVQRLSEMIGHQAASLTEDPSQRQQYIQAKMDQIRFFFVQNSHMLMRALRFLQQATLHDENENISLFPNCNGSLKSSNLILVIDSVAAVFRSDECDLAHPESFSSTPTIRSRNRSAQMFELATLLKKFAYDRPRTWVVITNEVTTDLSPPVLFGFNQNCAKFSKPSASNEPEVKGEMTRNEAKEEQEDTNEADCSRAAASCGLPKLKPALGHQWSQNVNRHYMLSRIDHPTLPLKSICLYPEGFDKQVYFTISAAGLQTAAV